MKLLGLFRKSAPAWIAGAAMACSGAEPAPTTNGETTGTLVQNIVTENGGKSRLEYYVSVDRKWTRLVVDGKKVDPHTVNTRVRIVGQPSADGRSINVERIEPSLSAGKLSQSLSSEAPAGRVAVVLVKDSRLPSGDPYSKQAARDALFDSPRSTNAFFKEVSYGKYGLSGDVFGWVSTDMTDCENTSAWRLEAEQAATQLGFVTDDYRHLVFLYERQGGGCFVANGSFGSPDGVGVIQSFQNSAGTMAHEVGHNLGLHHGTLLSCVDPHFGYTTYGSNCAVQEYNDPFDAMGYDGFYFHFNSYSKELQGWLPPSNVARATSNGTFTLVPQETAANALQSLLIPIPNSTDLFHVELRKKYGFDNEDRFDGAVLVRRVSEYGLYQFTNLLDMTPDGNPTNAALPVGETFQDELSGISISVVSQTNGQAVVSVTFGGESCSDGVQNNQESDVDCGGLCQPCGTGQSCTAQKECDTGACYENTCVQSEGGLTGQYYNGLDFDQLALTRKDRYIDFNWGSGSPAPQVQVDRFSVRWTASLVAPKSGVYEFKAFTDDGVRLWVGDELVIDRWHDATESQGSVELVEGEAYELKMEYFEDGGGAQARLLWAPPGETFDLVSPALLTAPGCSLDTAIDLGPRTTTTSVPSDACVKVSQFPGWWQFTNGSLTLQSGTGSFPVPLVWQNDCTSSSGDETLVQSYQSLLIGSGYGSSCPALIDLNGDGSPLQLSWF
jgi:hypothetical protein